MPGIRPWDLLGCLFVPYWAIAALIVHNWYAGGNNLVRQYLYRWNSPGGTFATETIVRVRAARGHTDGGDWTSLSPFCSSECVENVLMNFMS